MKKLILSFLLLLSWSMVVSGQPGPERQPLPFHPDVRQGILDNGLRYFILPNEKPEDRAELRLAIRAGSLQEDGDQLGVAHFVEHMAFNGTEHFAKNELIDYLESTGMRFGADLNAYTSFDQTVYMLQVRTDSLELLETGLQVLEDWAGGITFDSLEVEKERGVIISEWRNSLSPEQRLQQQYFPILYEGSRYAERLPIGDPDLIRTVEVETVRRFYQDWYRPDLMAVVAVGDFDVAWMEKELKERFSRLQNPGKTRDRKAYPVPGHAETLIFTGTDPEAPFTRIQVLFKHPGAEKKIKTEEDFKAYLARALYNRMLNGRLFELQQQADPPFTFAYSGYGGDVGQMETYTTSAFVKEGEALRGIGAVLRETMRARQHGFTSTELDRQKADMLRGAEKAFLERDKARSGSLASQCVSYFLDDNLLIDAEQNLDLYRKLLPAITLEDINPLPSHWLTPDNRVVIVTGPEKEDAPLPTEEVLLTFLDSIDRLDLEPYVDQVSDAPLLAQKPEPRAVAEEKYLADLDVYEWTLSNGLKVVLKPTDFKNDEIQMSAFSPGGHSLYSDEVYPSAAAAAALVDLSGIGELNLTELQKKLTGKSLTVGPYLDELYEGFSGYCSPEDLETMLQLIYLYFTHPRKEQSALLSYVSRQRSIFENILANPYYYYAEEKNKIKYGNHPRRRLTSLEELDQISLDQAYAIFRERFSDAEDFTFVFVGNLVPDSVRTLLITYLGSLPSTDREEQWKNVGADLVEGPLDTTIVRGQAPKALVEIVFHGDFEYDDPQNRYDFYSLTQLLRNKLRESMREDQGGVYGVRLNGFTSPFPEPRFRTTLSFNCDPAEVDTLIQTAIADIRHIQEAGATEADLAKIRETQIQSRKTNLKENGFWLGQLATRYRYGVPLSGILLDAYQKYVDGLSSETIQQAARRYLDTERYLQIVLMPEGE